MQKIFSTDVTTGTKLSNFAPFLIKDPLLFVLNAEKYLGVFL